jgi:hypothetical protein
MKVQHVSMKVQQVDGTIPSFYRTFCFSSLIFFKLKAYLRRGGKSQSSPAEKMKGEGLTEIEGPQRQDLATIVFTW